MLPFKRVYGAVVTVTVVLFATLPFSRQLSFWALGFDQSLMDAASVDSFRAYRETAFLRAGLFWSCAVFVGASLLLSLIALVWPRWEGDRMNKTVALVVLVLAALLASVLLMVHIAPHGPLV